MGIPHTPPLVSAAIGSLVRKGIVVLFAYFGFDRILAQGEHAALVDWLSGLAMIAVGVLVTQVWAWLSDKKLLEMDVESAKGPKGQRAK